MFLPGFSSKTDMKLQIIHITPQMVERVITHFNSYIASGPNCILVTFLKNYEPEF